MPAFSQTSALLQVQEVRFSKNLLRKAESLYKNHRTDHQYWAKKYMKAYFSKVLWSGEVLEQMAGPVVDSLMDTEHQFQSDDSKVCVS